MAQLPQNLIASMGLGKQGLMVTRKELANHLINNGYGPDKARNWVDNLVNTGAIYIVSEQVETGLPLYTTIWWNHMDLLRTRVRRPRVRLDDLTEEEIAILQKTAPVARTEVLE